VGHETPRGGPGVLALTVSETGQIVSSGRDGKIITWEYLTGTAVQTLTGHGEGTSITNGQVVSSLGLSSAGEIISGSWDMSGRVWTKNGEVKAHLKEGHSAAVLGVCGLGTGEILTACGDGKIRIWGDDGTCRKTCAGASLPLRGVAGLEGVGFVSVSNDSVLRLFSRAGDLISQINTGGETLYAVACNPHTKRDFPEVIVGGEGGICKVYAVNPTASGLSLELVESIPHPAAVYGVAVTPNGDIVTAGEDRTARVWTREESRYSPASVRELFDAKVEALRAMQLDDTPVVSMASSSNNNPATSAQPPAGQYQHVYPVEIDTGERLEIAWNSGEDANVVAQRFLSANRQIPKVSQSLRSLSDKNMFTS